MHARRLLVAVLVLLALAGTAHAQLRIPNDQVALVTIEAHGGGFLDSRYTGYAPPRIVEDSSIIGTEVNTQAPLFIVGTIMTRDNATGLAEFTVTATMGRGQKLLGPLVVPVEVVEPGDGGGGETVFVGAGLRVSLLSFQHKP